MSDFNADPNPDLNKIRTVAFNYRLADHPVIKVDQFSTAGANKVYHCVRKIGSTRLQFLVDPTKIIG